MQRQGLTGRILRIGVLLGFVLSASAFPASTCAQEEATGAAEVKYENGLISVKAEETDLAGLLRKVAEAARTAIEINPDVSGRVSVSFVGVSVEEGIKRVLEASGRTNFAAEIKRTIGATDKVVSLEKIIVASGKQGQMPSQVAAKGAQSLAALYEHVQKRYGKYEASTNEVTRRVNGIRFQERGVSKTVSRGNLEAYCSSKIEEFSSYFGTPVSQLRLDKVEETPLHLKCLYRQEIGSVPVENVGVSLFIWKLQQGTIAPDTVSFGDGAVRDINMSTEPKLTAEEAVKVAETKYRELVPDLDTLRDLEKNLQKPPRLVIYPKPIEIPGGRPTGYTYHLAWIINRFLRIYYVDAHTGQIVREISSRKSSRLDTAPYGR